MKYSTALKQSKASARRLAAVVPAAWALFAWRPIWQFGALAGFLSFYLVSELLTIRQITRSAAEDPDYLQKRIS